jgi:peptidoglycan/LPS O-acetylase OafA/YrhL
MSIRYQPQLDGLRAIAIAAVFVQHFAPEWVANRYVPVGYLGVELFFVLSGFLITMLLLADRTAISGGRTSVVSALKNFYLRRSLRIFPTYYLAISFALIAGLGVTFTTFPWLASYLTNFWIVRHGGLGSSNHLWSLAVEEQFYLVWAFAVLLIPARVLPVVIALCAVASVTYQFAAVSVTYSEFLLLSCAVYLVAGSALATAPRATVRLAQLTLAVSSVSIFFLPADEIVIAARLIAGSLFVMVVESSWIGFRGPVGQVLASRPLVYLGRISYGLYLYHLFIPEGIDHLRFYKLNLNPLVTLRIVSPFCALVIAAASWHFIEKPIQRWRRQYFDRAAPRSTTS